MRDQTPSSTSVGSDARRRVARRLRIALALVFLGLGGWCLVDPLTVETLALRPEFQHLSPTSALLMKCFGAQAVLVGSLALLSRFTARTFLVFGLLASLPFFVFNAWFVWINPMFTSLMLLDFAGNLSFFLIGWYGWHLMRHEAEAV